MIEKELESTDRLLLIVRAQGRFEQVRKCLIAISAIIGTLLVWEILYHVSTAARTHNNATVAFLVALGAWELIHFLRPAPPSEAREYLKKVRRTDSFTIVLDEKGLRSFSGESMLALNQITAYQIQDPELGSSIATLHLQVRKATRYLPKSGDIPFDGNITNQESVRLWMMRHAIPECELPVATK